MQGDAHECFQLMLSGVHGILQADEVRAREMAGTNSSAVVHVFGGAISSELTKRCGHVSVHKEVAAMQTLELSIDDPAVSCVRTALAFHFRVEQLQGAIECSEQGCTTKSTGAQKTLVVDVAAKVMVISFKRKLYDMEQKVDTFVEKTIGLPQFLDMAPYVRYQGKRGTGGLTWYAATVNQAVY